MSHRLRSQVLVLLLLASPVALSSQTASLVKDLSPGFDPFADASPRQLLAARGKVFFQAWEPSTGGEIWVSDGTAAGTTLLADTCTGNFCDEAEVVGSAGDLVFLRGGHGDLWRSDGTRAGTWPLLPETLKVRSPSDGAVFVALGGVLYFEGCTNEIGCELWRSDGTAAGTRLVKAVSNRGSLVMQFLGAAAGRLFLASGYFPDFKLWTSDGTADGTTVIKQLPTIPRLAAATPGRIFLALAVPGKPEELWASDGTTAETLSLASFPLPNFGNAIPWLKIFGNRVYLEADDIVHGHEIWRSDGTPQGTVRVTNFGFFDPFGGHLDPQHLEEAGGRAVFFATDGLSKVKLWSAEGAAAPPTVLAEVCSDCQQPSYEWTLARTGGRVVFQGYDAVHGLELWSTDGTVAGTTRLTDVCSGPCDSLMSQPVAGAGAVFVGLREGFHTTTWRSDGTAQGTRRFAAAESGLDFIALGGQTFFAAHDDYGWELWTSDGTPEGAGPVTDIARGPASSDPGGLTPLGDRIAFSADSPDGRLWLSGGTAETTVAVEAGDPSLEFPDLVVAAGRLFYYKRDDLGSQLWTTDGTPGSQRQLTSFDFDRDFGGGRPLIEHQGRLLFPVFDGSRVELWTSDGSVAGTTRSFTLPAAIDSIADMRSLGDQIFLVANDGSLRPHPWLSNGTTAGTRQLSTLEIDPFSKLEAVRLGGIIFYVANYLWMTDGTPAGTARVLPSSDFFLGAGARNLTIFQNSVYFLAGVDGTSLALWRSDGSAAGTTVVQKFKQVDWLTQAGGRLFFIADDGIHGNELWTSDGTTAGTVLVRDILPGAAGSAPTSLHEAAGRLYFAADEGVHGTELWTSDGTAAGTRMVQDLAPEALASFPEGFTVAGNRLFFTADDGESGRELWTLPLAASGCVPSATSLCLSNGRFRVETIWRDPEGHTGRGQAVALTPDTGYFWFFGPENVEAIVKVLDGRGLNDHVWVFYGALSNVEYSLTVTDTQTGLTRRYFNPQGRFASVGDTLGFGPLGAYDSKAIAPPSSPPLVSERTDPAANASCVPTAQRLCLNGGRFAVEASWKDFSGRTGTATAVRLTGDTGYFWFFGESNVEVVLKVLDGRPVNGKFWVYYGALSNVEYTLTVTDTATGKVKTYRNPIGRFASSGDTAAF